MYDNYHSKGIIFKYKSAKQTLFSTGRVVLELPSWLVRDQITGFTFTCLPAFMPAILWLYPCGWITNWTDSVQTELVCKKFWQIKTLLCDFQYFLFCNILFKLHGTSKFSAVNFLFYGFFFSMKNHICGHICFIIKALN